MGPMALVGVPQASFGGPANAMGLTNCWRTGAPTWGGHLAQRGATTPGLLEPPADAAARPQKLR